MFCCIDRCNDQALFSPPSILHHKTELFLLVTALAVAALGAFAFGQVGLVKDFSKTLKISLVAGGGGAALIFACYLKYCLSTGGVTLSERRTDARVKSTIFLVIALAAAVLGACALARVGLVKEFSQPLKISLVAGGGSLALILACYIKYCLSTPPPPPVRRPAVPPIDDRSIDEKVRAFNADDRRRAADDPPPTGDEDFDAAIRASLDADDPDLRLAVQRSLEEAAQPASAAAVVQQPFIDKYFIKLQGFDGKGETIPFQSVMCNPNATIEVIKGQIAKVTGYLAADQRLIYKGQILSDDRTLASYNIPSRETIFVVTKPKG